MIAEVVKMRMAEMVEGQPDYIRFALIDGLARVI